jgi:hypothetical protein
MKFTISPDADQALAQDEDVGELFTQVSDLPLGKIDESLKSYVAVLHDGSGLSRAPSFRSNRRVIQSDRKADTCSRSMDTLPDIGFVLSVPHGSYRDLVPHLKSMFQSFTRPKIAQETIGFYLKKKQIACGLAAGKG